MTSLRTHAEQHNSALYRDYKKDRKVGEGAYAVVYLGTKTKGVVHDAIKQLAHAF